MRDDLRIRTGQLADAERLAVLSTQVWLHTYCTDGINSDIAQYVLSELTTERWSLRLQDPQVRILVAERGDFLVGFAAVSFGAPCPSGASSSVELQTLYVQAHCMGQGIGKRLLESAESTALQQCASPLWLTVNAQNARAIAFYARQGYAKVGSTYFVLGQGRHENHVLLGSAASLPCPR